MPTYIEYPGYLPPTFVTGGSPMALVSPGTLPGIAVPPVGPFSNSPQYTNQIGPNIVQAGVSPGVPPGVAAPVGPSGDLAQYVNQIGSNIVQVVADNPTTLRANGTTPPSG